MIALGVLSVGTMALAADSEGGLASAPLSARSGPRGSTLFTLLDPAKTGIVTENRYDDPKMWGEHYQELAYGEMGTGVAIGDYDNDGRPDLFVVSKTGTCRLFRNLGNWKFEDVTEKAGLSASAASWTDRISGWIGLGENKERAEPREHWQQGAAFADVNNDGWLDIYVCRFGAPNLLYINQGDGTFKEEAASRGLAVVDACGMAAFCDYDRDGWLDVYIHTNLLDASTGPNGRRDYLFHNNGNGTFTDVTARAGISGEKAGHAALWWDFDNDGWPDLYVTNDYATPDRLYHNNRDGTFTDVIDAVAPHTPYYSMSADLGDINNDGRMDLLVSDMAATTHEKDQRGMATSRARAQLPPENEASAPQYMRNALLLNTGTGHCLEVARLVGVAATDWTWSVRFEDLDNDGRIDLFVTNGMTREYHNADLLDRLMSAENIAEPRRITRASPKLVERHLAYRNLGDLRFEDVGAAWGLDQKGVSFGSAFGDFDGDGDLDLVYSNYESGVTVLRNDSDTGHRLIVALRGTQSNRFGVGSTVRIESASGQQVRQLVLARGYLSTSEPILHFGLGEDTRIQRLTVSWPSGQTQTFADLAVDQRLTITEPASPVAHPVAPAPMPPGQFTDVSEPANFSFVAREAPRQETGAQPLLPVRFDRQGPALAVGDIDGDGRDDVVIGATSAAPAHLCMARGSPLFRELDPSGVATDAQFEDGPIAVFDADGDGTNDVLVTKAGTSLPDGASDYQPTLFLNDGHGRLQPASTGPLPRLAISAGALAVADFNRDGWLDVFIGGRVRPDHYPLAPQSALLANRSGRFEDVTDSVAPGLREVGMVTSAIWSDVDGDGWPDLLLTLEWGQVKLFHNEQGKALADWTEKAGFAAAGTGWWTSIAAADFNGDGRPDFVVGNVGLNTQYHASEKYPALLYYGAFEDNAAPQLIEAYYEAGRLYPWRTRKELGSHIPSILRRFPRNDSYARASLGEILGEPRLAAAQRFAATEFQSGVFLSQPDGTYRFAPLPRIAQVSPLQGLVAGDFDGDGKADIYAVQNSYAPIPVVGRFDGGLSQLLRGDGKGNFTPVAPAESGLVVTGDAKALAVIDLDGDGWPDFLVTRNNGTTRAYRNGGYPGRHSLRVSLHGPAGNPTGIGARVSLELSDGSTQTSEIYAGSGYHSQSSPSCFFGYIDANPPRRIRVRWPSGASTVKDVAAGSNTITIFP